MVNLLDDDIDPEHPGIPVALDGPLAVLIRSGIARKVYIRLAAAAGTEQIRAAADRGMLRPGTGAGSILSPEEMAADDE
jgi:hypothetical protein